ncbi:MAG: pimeloyl-ACP methyl ester carboxylesterase, partial [Zhongshania marina]
MNENNRTITVNGVNLHVREWNPEAQPTIVMVHG